MYLAISICNCLILTIFNVSVHWTIYVKIWNSDGFEEMEYFHGKLGT